MPRFSSTGDKKEDEGREGSVTALSTKSQFRAVILRGLATSIGLHGTTCTDTAIGGVETKNCVGDGRAEFEPRRSWHSHQAITIAIAVEARRNPHEGKRWATKGAM